MLQFTGMVLNVVVLQNYQMPEQQQLIIKGLDESMGPSMICQIKLKKIFG